MPPVFLDLNGAEGTTAGKYLDFVGALPPNQGQGKPRCVRHVYGVVLCSVFDCPHIAYLYPHRMERARTCKDGMPIIRSDSVQLSRKSLLPHRRPSYVCKGWQ